jgi:TctA family transporter
MNGVAGYFGTLGLSAAMTLVMLVIYKFISETTSDRVKTLVVVGVGFVLSIVSIIYKGGPLGFVCLVDCFFYGIQLGATSIGLFKVGQATGVFKGM